MRRAGVITVLSAIGILACRGGDLAAGVDEATFVATMAALHRVNQIGVLDSADHARARDSVLQGRGLTPDQLAAAARSLADDPDRAAAVWRRIAAEAADTTVPREEGSSPRQD